MNAIQNHLEIFPLSRAQSNRLNFYKIHIWRPCFVTAPKILPWDRCPLYITCGLVICLLHFRSRLPKRHQMMVNISAISGLPRLSKYNCIKTKSFLYQFAIWSKWTPCSPVLIKLKTPNGYCILHENLIEIRLSQEDDFYYPTFQRSS